MKRPLTPKGILLGFILFLLAVASTLLVQSLRPETAESSAAAAQQP